MNFNPLKWFRRTPTEQPVEAKRLIVDGGEITVYENQTDRLNRKCTHIVINVDPEVWLINRSAFVQRKGRACIALEKMKGKRRKQT